MAMTRKDLEEIAYAINWNSKSEAEAKRTIHIIEEGLARATGLNVNGNRKFDSDKFRKAATERWTRADQA